MSSSSPPSPPPPPEPPRDPPPDSRPDSKRANRPAKRGRARRSAAVIGRRAREVSEALAEPARPQTALLANSPRRWVRLLPYGVALVLTVVLLPVTIQVLSQDYGLNGGISGALAVAQTAPLLLAVFRPLQAWYIIFVADVVGALALLSVEFNPDRPWPWPPMVIVAYLPLCLAVALRERRLVLLGVWMATVVSGIGLGMVDPERSKGTNVLLIVLSGVVLFLGAAVRERAEAQRRLAEQETISEAERARRTLLEERARIARELHDVVAHHMSVITVQADSAAYRIGGLPQEAQEEFNTIAATARESLSEMRRLLGVLRSEGTQGERVPQPGLDQIRQLVEATVRAGVPVELALDPDEALPPELPQAVGLSAYRIVQEALANVVRHAPGASTRVSVAASDTTLTVLVVNGPSPAPSAPLETTGTGHGLVGMRERVRLVGGALDTGPLPDGGYRVAARLPLTPADGPTNGPATPDDSANAAITSNAADTANTAERADAAGKDSTTP